MHARDGDAVLQTHQFGEHLSAWHHWDFAGARFKHLGIVAGYGGARDHNIARRRMGSSVSDVDRRTQGLQPVSDR